MVSWLVVVAVVPLVEVLVESLHEGVAPAHEFDQPNM
jgi:hypothetical protein